MTQEASGAGIVDHYTWAAKKGVMNPNTAGSLKAAAQSVLLAFDPDNWKQLDLTKLNVEEALQRFRNLKSREYTPTSLEVVQNRFRRAVASYFEYLQDPAGWKPTTRTVTPRKSNDGKKSTPTGGADVETPESQPFTIGMLSASISQSATSKLMDYPFPLREGVIAHLHLPRDLTAKDVRRLHVFMQSLVLDDVGSGT